MTGRSGNSFSSMRCMVMMRVEGCVGRTLGCLDTHHHSPSYSYCNLLSQWFEYIQVLSASVASCSGWRSGAVVTCMTLDRRGNELKGSRFPDAVRGNEAEPVQGHGSFEPFDQPIHQFTQSKPPLITRLEASRGYIVHRSLTFQRLRWASQVDDGSIETIIARII
jgi:hypothetical protein